MPRKKQKKYFYVYKTTRSDGRYYIGVHSTYNLDDNYLGSGKKLQYSIKKYGEENHSREILEFFESKDLAYIRESEIVNQECLDNPNCMNIRLGGKGGWDHANKIKTKEEKTKLAFLGNSGFRKKLEDPEFKKIFSEKCSKNLKQSHKEGKFKYDTFTGKSHSEESKRKMSESSKGTQIGEKNSQFGTCWINNGFECKKIKKDQLDFWFEQNWKLGRLK